MFGSSSPFGATSPSPFGAPAATNPFGANPNPFGTNTQANNSFGAKPFGSTTPAFGAQAGSSLFGSGTSTGVFGATATPAFGASASSSAFGASSTTPAFGAFGQQKPASPFGGFGGTQPQQNPFGSPSFGQSQPAFGSQPFGSTTPAFGAQSAPAFGSTTTPLFGASTPAFGAASTPAFGATGTPAFGAASTPAFGASTSTPSFGASAPAFGGSSAFGQSAPAFGASTTPAFGSAPAASPFGASSGSAFGSSFGTSTFGGQQQQQRVGTRVTPYAVTNDTDSGVGAQAGKFLCISAMPAYKDKQLEELRWEDHQAGDKGGPNPATTSQPAPGGIFGQQPQQQTPATSSPFGAGSASFGQGSTPNPFASTPTTNPFSTKPTFGSPSTPAPAPAFGQTAAPAFGTSTFGSSTPAFGAASAPAFGQASSTPAFGSSPSPFGQTSASAFGSSTFGASSPSLFGQSTPAFGASSPAFGGAASTPAFGAQTASAFGGGNLFGNSQLASSGGGLFGASTPGAQPFGASAAPGFGQSQAGLGSNLFGNTSSPGSIFGQTKPAGLTQSMSSSLFSGFGATPVGQTPSAFSFPSSQTPQQGASNNFGGTPSTFGLQNTFGQQQPTQNVMSATSTPVTNPFGTLPAMPQITIGRSAGSGPSVQYGISSIPVSEKPTQVRVNTLLTPRHITQRSKVRMHARRYHPKKDSPKVSFFSDGDEAPSTPKADVMFVPRENPRSLFIRQPDQSPLTPTAVKSAPDVREIATPIEKDGFPDETRDEAGGDSVPFSFPESPQTNWRSPDNANGNGSVDAPPVSQAKSSERAASKQVPKTNGFREEHNHRGNGYISITGHRAGEAAIAYEHGADIEALMPKLRHSDYFTDPKVQELAALERADSGYCRRVPDFVVGRKGYGQIKFLGETDVRRLDLENIVQFNKCEVLVYMDETKKPAVGQGLNKAAEVTLLNVKCVDKKTGQHHAEGPEVEKFEKRLRKKTEEQGAVFLGYDGAKGEWRFRVKHFSRYGLDLDSDEEDGHEGHKEGALVVAGTYDMEGVEEGAEHDADDFMYESPLRNLDVIPEPGVGMDEEVEDDLIDASYFTAPQSALPHSLPAHLHLDPVKMQQMRALFFAEGEEAEDIAPPGTYSRWQSRAPAPSPVVISSGIQASQSFKTPQKAAPGEEADGRPAWPQRSSPWKGTPAKQMRVSPLTSWNRSPAYSALEEGMSGRQTPILDVSPSRSPLLALTMSGDRERSGVKRSRGSGFWLDPTEKSGSMALGRSDHIADAALFLGCSFRVGWGPTGILYHCSTQAGQGGTKNGLSSCIQMERVALDRTVRDDEGVVKEELVELQFVSPLSLHMAMSQVVDNPSESGAKCLRLRTLACSRTDLPSVCGEYEELVLKQHDVVGVGEADQVVLRHQRTVWQLMSVLFSETPNPAEVEDESEEVADIQKSSMEASAEVLIRRAGFSCWLQESVGHLVQQDLQHLKGNSYLKEIFSLLTGRRVDDAVEKALERGDVRMSTLLCQAGGPVGMRSDIAAQLEVWVTEGLDESLIEADRMPIFQLLAGDLKGALAGHKIDWKRFLGLVMWYELSPDTDLPCLIETFEGLLEKQDAPKPVPKYVEERVSGYNSQFEGEGYDTAYYLMLLHAKRGKAEVSSRKMLSASASTFDRLDHKLAWHQQGILHAIGMLEAEQLHEVHMNFASQLLSAGLCHWAVYVVLHMPSSSQHPGLHEKVVKEILNQYCEIWSRSEAQQRFLEDDLEVPAEWLHEALALYWRYCRNNKKELEHLLKSCQWRSAHVLFMTTVAASLFLNCTEHSEMWQFASQLEGHLTEVEDWDLGAGIYIEFFTLRSSFIDVSDRAEGLETLEERTAACGAFFERLKESQVLWKSKSTVDARVAYSKMADEISSLLLAETKTQSLEMDTEMKVFDIVLDAPLPDDVRMCRLQGAVAAFTKLISAEIPV